MINENLTLLEFKKLPPGHQSAFGEGTVRVETLLKGFMLFKLTAGRAPSDSKWGITPWWSPVKPFKEDYEGALGRYQQAKLNGIDMSALVRFMSAVCVDWNDLDNYVQVALTDDCRAFWGTFAPQKKFSKSGTSKEDKFRQRVKDWQINRGAELPPDLGVLEAWQLYIPNLKEADIKRASVISAHDMVALGMALGFV